MDQLLADSFNGCKNVDSSVIGRLGRNLGHKCVQNSTFELGYPFRVVS